MKAVAPTGDEPDKIGQRVPPDDERPDLESHGIDRREGNAVHENLIVLEMSIAARKLLMRAVRQVDDELVWARISQVAACLLVQNVQINAPRLQHIGSALQERALGAQFGQRSSDGRRVGTQCDRTSNTREVPYH